jgi:8-oxo-dGTP pyrophosphatase MutT (NUDIX family)
LLFEPQIWLTHIPCPPFFQSALEGSSPPDFLAERSLRACAVREVFEETGVLLATQPFTTMGERLSSQSPDTISASDAMEKWRKASQQKSDEFNSMLALADAAPDFDALHPWDWWLTPREEKSKWRYNTLFYVGECRFFALPYLFLAI